MATTLSFTLSAPLTAPAAQALPARSFERAELFASCAGRLAALAAHQHGYGEAGAERTQALVETFEMMLDATLPDAYADGVPEGQSDKWRNWGWRETAMLLAASHSSYDTLSADDASDALAERIAACTSVVLSDGAVHGHVMRTESPMR